MKILFSILTIGIFLSLLTCDMQAQVIITGNPRNALTEKEFIDLLMKIENIEPASSTKDSNS
jgi:hypothetical protein